MGRIVRGGLIQVQADISLEGTAEEIKQRMLDKHVPLIEEAGKAGRPAPLPAGAVQRTVLLRRAAAALVRDGGTDPRRTDDHS